MNIFTLAYFDDVRDLPNWAKLLLFLVPLVSGLTIYFYKTRHARSWRKGIYPISLKFNQENLLEAYLALASLLVLADYQQSKNKTQFINSYFNRYFPKANYNFGDSLLFSMKHPIQIETVCAWLNKNLSSPGERSQVIYFLTGVAYLEETISRKELAFLQIMNDQLHLDKKHLHRIIESYARYHSSKQNNTSTPKTETKQALSKSYLAILGLSIHPTKKEVKKAYRKLAKQHHPDVFANASTAQQKIAKDSFLKIQEAYDYLMHEG